MEMSPETLPSISSVWLKQKESSSSNHIYIYTQIKKT